MDPKAALLMAALRRHRVARAAELAGALGISQPTLSRLVRSLQGEVVTIGRARRTRYALTRRVRGLPVDLPVFRVDGAGRPQHQGVLSALDPEGAYLDGSPGLGWPVDESMLEGLYPGLPYFMVDVRPQGFLGRSFARQHGPQLGLPSDPTRWSDDEVIAALALAGEDLPGDLIVGETSLEAFQRRRVGGVASWPAGARSEVYPEQAMAALRGEAPGSSAGGEFPKFTAAVLEATGMRHVIVKFSPADDSAAATRWRDLLIAEHQAAAALLHLDVPAPASSILSAGGRIFLEVSRFDRIAEHGRAGVVTLASIEPALLGLGEMRWERAAAQLHKHGWLSAQDVRRVVLMSLFGGFIGNTDMHAGNLAFLQTGPGKLAVAPAYDMLPMLFAPTRAGELVERELQPAPPPPGFEDDWRAALEAGIRYWDAAAADVRMSSTFHAICTDSLRRLHQAGKQFG